MNPPPPSSPSNRPGRAARLTYDDAVVEMICALIQTDGISDTRAGLLAGLSAQALSQWKKQHDGFADRLQRARAEFQRQRLEWIREARGRDGAVDWRAQAWLAEKPGSGVGTLGEEEATTDANTDADAEGKPPLAVSRPQLALLQERRDAATAKGDA